jgi:flagellar protein FlaC
MGKGEDDSVENTEETNSNKEISNTEITEDRTPEKNTQDTNIENEDIKKIIKLGSTDENDAKKEKISNEDQVLMNEPELSSREALEQRRTILQSIKEYDFLIKKNQEELTDVHNKIDSLTKDLDDLVSLYEIVSEQMNPFVGLSKVTKKRIEALENFDKDIDSLKDRTADLESFAVKNGMKLKRPLEKSKKTDTEGEVSGELDDQTPLSSFTINNDMLQDLSDTDLDIILDRTLGSLYPDGKIDMIINEFIESLKG